MKRHISLAALPAFSFVAEIGPGSLQAGPPLYCHRNSFDQNAGMVKSSGIASNEST